ncbi:MULTISPECIES: hypothetical protein [unclassified Bradyrhizobium]
MANAKRLAKSKSAKSVSVSEMARHLDLSRARILQLADAGTLQREVGGTFDLEACRLAYIRALRSARPPSTKSEAETALMMARAQKVQIEIAEKKKELIHINDMLDFVDALAGIMLPALGGLPARATRDLELRKGIEKAVFDLRTDIANACRKKSGAYEEDMKRHGIKRERRKDGDQEEYTLQTGRQNVEPR